MKNFLLMFTHISSLLFYVNSQISDRIIGGDEARSGQFPFAAAITVTNNDLSRFFCGGALLNTNFILTSAHCIKNAVDLSIILGTTSLTEYNPYRIIADSSEYFVHPDFDNFTLENDIALIKLRIPIVYNDYVGKIHLPVTDYDSGVSVTALGWGQTSDGNSAPVDMLNCVPLVTITNDECRIYYHGYVTDKMICVSGNYAEGMCTGDSGTPLVYFLNQRHPIHVGVATFISFSGCESPEPSGYTRTFPYREWILNITGVIN